MQVKESGVEWGFQLKSAVRSTRRRKNEKSAPRTPSGTERAFGSA
jgi:hypothetical protein